MSDFSHDLAVLIGIDQYGSGITPLQTAVNDVQELAEILEKDHQYQVAVLVNQQATLNNLLQLIHEALPKRIQPNSRLLFYFAGHGIALNGDDGPEGYLIPQDAKVGDTSTYLSMPKLQEALSAWPCRHFLGILDCCFAGAFRWSSTRDLLSVPEVIHKERYDRFIADPAWQIITSAAYDQKALDSLEINSERGQTNGNHSPFAAALINALEGGADVYPPAQNGKPAGDGVITATELYLYLRDQVEVATEEHRQRQTPGIWPLKNHDKGEYIFLSPGHELNLPPAPPLDESKNPYRGLQSFEEEQSDLFFGRQMLTEKLGRFANDQPLTVVLGASGSGKSSLVKAGLIPFLKQQDAKNAQSQWQVLAPMRPGEAPFKALGSALNIENMPSFSMLKAGSNAETEMLSQYMAAWCQKYPQQKLMLPIDQFEELITLCQNEKERENFLQGLAQALNTYSNQLRLVLTLRSDFEPQFQDTGLKDYWSAGRFVVPPMTRLELREAIEAPASKRVMYFQSNDLKNPLIDQLIDEVAEMPGALPLLSFSLSELYLKYLRRQDDTKMSGDTIDRAITEADYIDLGGVARSLTQRADQEYDALVKQDTAYEQTIRHVMLRMVAVGGGELARRRVPLSEFEYPPEQNERVKTVIQRFSAARLLVEGKNTNGKPYVEPAHDALVRGWQKLLTWKQEQEEDLLLQRRVTPVAEEWKNQLKTKFLWHTNPRLDLLKKVLNSDDNWLNELEADFVRRSVRRKSFNTQRNWAVAISVMSLLATGLVFSLIGQRNAQLGEARASRQAAEANLATGQELDALIEALRAGRSLEKLLPFGLFQPPEELAQVRGTLAKAVQVRERSHLNLANLVRKTQGKILWEIFFDRDGKLIAAFSEDNYSTPNSFWDIETQENLQEKPERYNSEFNPISLEEPDLRNEVISSDSLSGFDRVFVSENKRLLVGISQVGIGTTNPPRISVLDRENGSRAILPPFSSYRNLRDLGIVLRKDGKIMATVDLEGTIRTRKLEESNVSELLVERASSAGMRSKFSDPRDPRSQEKLQKAKNAIHQDLKNNNPAYADLIDGATVFFGPGDEKVAIVFENVGTNDVGRVFYFWDLESNKELENIREELGNEELLKIEDISFSPDGRLLAIASRSSLIIWDLQENQRFDDSFHGDVDCNLNVHKVVFDPDSRLIATASFNVDTVFLNYSASDISDSYICLRDLSGNQLAKFEADSWIGLSFSSDSKQLFTSEIGSDNISNAWQIESLDELIIHACSLVSDYLKAPGSTASENDRILCDDVEIPDQYEPFSFVSNRSTTENQQNEQTQSSKDLLIPPTASQMTAEDFYARGINKSNQQDYSGAIEDLSQAIEVDPGYALAYLSRGFSYEKTGDRESAFEDYRKTADLYQQQGKTEEYNKVQENIESLQIATYSGGGFTITITGFGTNASYRGCDERNQCLSISRVSAYNQGSYVWENGEYQYLMSWIGNGDYQLSVANNGQTLVDKTVSPVR